MPAGLLGDPITGIDEDDNQVGVGSSRDHIAGILCMPRSISDDKLALIGSKIAISHIDGDSLFAFGTEAIGQDSQINPIFVFIFGLLFEHLKLVGQDTLTIV